MRSEKIRQRGERRGGKGKNIPLFVQKISLFSADELQKNTISNS